MTKEKSFEERISNEFAVKATIAIISELKDRNLLEFIANLLLINEMQRGTQAADLLELVENYK